MQKIQKLIFKLKMKNLLLNPQRLKLARERRGLSATKLSEKLGVTSRTLSNYENGHTELTMQDSIIEKLSKVLNYPIPFFFSDDLIEVKPENVSFRSMARMSAKKRDAALSAGSIAMEFHQWLDKRFNLPKPDIPEFNHPESTPNPDVAARQLREYWGLGEKSIPNMVHLLESKGIRVYSLAQDCVEVDAYSYWIDEQPFIFLNNQKTPERSRFDAAHELGHLLLHKRADTVDKKAIEAEANQFASAFLMPESAIRAVVPFQPSFTQLLELKKYWNVSLTALIKRTFDLKLSTEWHYRQLQIMAAKHGYRTSEPNGMLKRETSQIIEKIIFLLKDNKISNKEIEQKLNIPLRDLADITFQHTYFSLRKI